MDNDDENFEVFQQWNPKLFEEPPAAPTDDHTTTAAASENVMRIPRVAKYKTRSVEEKIAIADESIATKNIAKIARKYDVDRKSIRLWQKQLTLMKSQRNKRGRRNINKLSRGHFPNLDKVIFIIFIIFPGSLCVLHC